MFQDHKRSFVLSGLVLLALTSYAYAQDAISVGASAPDILSNIAPASATITPSTASGKAQADLSPAAASSDMVPPVPMPSSPSKSMSGITIPAPPPPAAFSTNTAQITTQAEQVAQQAEAQAAATKEKQDEEHNNKSFERAVGGMLPLSADQIRDFMHRLEMTDEASRTPSYGVPKGDVRIVTLSLDPGTTPPQINLQGGFVTTINIVDASGQPWPILDVGVGGNFEVTATKTGSHVIRVMPLSNVADGNLSVMLKELSTPIIFRLTAGNHQVDMRFDARIPKFGPNAKIPLINKPRLEAGNENLMMLLQNLPPKDAKRMKVSGLDARTMAWSLDDHVFVRTPLTLLSPAWDASVSSDDGMTVYEVGDAPVLLMSDNGALIRAHILQDEDHDR